MLTHRSFSMVLLLMTLQTSCAVAIDERAVREPISIVELIPGRTVINKAVPALHERTGDVPPPVLLTAKDRPWPWHVTLQEERSSFSLTVTPTDAAAKDELLLTFWDWENRPAAQSKVISDKPRRFDVSIEGRGVYMVTLDGFRDGKHAYRVVRSFAVLSANNDAKERWKQSDYWVGICAFPGRYHWNSGGKPSKPEAISEEKARRIEAEAMAKLGLTVARLDVSMVLPENEGAPIDWKRMDAAVDAYTSRGFELALQLMHPPDWAMEEKYRNETKDRWRFPRREEPYRRYVREIVRRYGRHAKFVQVYNEPDQLEFWAASPEEFITEFDRACDEIRKALPTTPITNGGYAFIDPKRTEYFTTELKGKLDLAAYHSHGNLRELKRDIDHMRQLHDKAGYDKPRYINTECGFAAWRLDQERAQAAGVVQKIIHSWARGDEGMLLFASRMTKAPGRTGRDFGFLDYDFCPRFVYGAVSAFVQQFAGARFERTLIESNDLHAYVFKRGEQRVIACFSIGESKTAAFETDARRATIFDAMGNIEAQVNDEPRIVVRQTALVKAIVLEGATRIEMAK